MRAGETIVLVGEDLNVDPQTGEQIDPLAAVDIPACLKDWTRIAGARRTSMKTGALPIDVYRAGKGALIIVNASVDRMAYHSSDFVQWHTGLKAALGSLDSVQGN